MKKIVLIVGPSGVGKDTLLKSIKNKIDANFVKRYITRKPDENEDNYHISKKALEILDNNCFFISSWSAYENTYAIAKDCIKEGLNIISVSRTVVKDFEKVYEKVYTLNITIDKNLLKQRLEKRDRENKEEIQKRLERSFLKIEAKNLIEFKNEQNLEDSSKEFLKLLEDIKYENL